MSKRRAETGGSERAGAPCGADRANRPDPRDAEIARLRTHLAQAHGCQRRDRTGGPVDCPGCLAGHDGVAEVEKLRAENRLLHDRLAGTQEDVDSLNGCVARLEAERDAALDRLARAASRRAALLGMDPDDVDAVERAWAEKAAAPPPRAGGGGGSLAGKEGDRG